MTKVPAHLIDRRNQFKDSALGPAGLQLKVSAGGAEPTRPTSPIKP